MNGCELDIVVRPVGEQRVNVRLSYTDDRGHVPGEVEQAKPVNVLLVFRG